MGGRPEPAFQSRRHPQAGKNRLQIPAPAGSLRKKLAQTAQLLRRAEFFHNILSIDPKLKESGLWETSGVNLGGKGNLMGCLRQRYTLVPSGPEPRGSHRSLSLGLDS